MRQTIMKLKFWETVFVASLVVYVIDHLFLFSAFFITLPLTFLIGIVACVFAMRDKIYIHMLLCVLGISLPIMMFLATPF